jgi:hypothetical protein
MLEISPGGVQESAIKCNLFDGCPRRKTRSVSPTRADTWEMRRAFSGDSKTLRHHTPRNSHAKTGALFTGLMGLNESHFLSFLPNAHSRAKCFIRADTSGNQTSSWLVKIGRTRRSRLIGSAWIQVRIIPAPHVRRRLTSSFVRFVRARLLLRHA